MVTKNSRQQVKRCLKSFLQWHIFTTFLLWINVRVKRSLGRHWGDWYWFMAACERLRRSGARGSLLSLQELGRYWEVLWRLARWLAWAQITMIYVEAGLWLTAANPWPASHRMMGGDIGAARPGQTLCSAPTVSPTLPAERQTKRWSLHYNRDFYWTN